MGGLNINKNTIFPFHFYKRFIWFISNIPIYYSSNSFWYIYFITPDNALEVSGLVTPLHIVPEWYFLCRYAMLKAVPNKNAGFIFFLFVEISNLTTLTRLMECNNGFSISFFFLTLLSFLCIGAQFPQEKFLSYGRILTLDYYFLLMCILFSVRKTWMDHEYLMTGIFCHLL